MFLGDFLDYEKSLKTKPKKLSNDQKLIFSAKGA